VRLRDIAAVLDITERSAYAIVTELADAGYLVKTKDGRRNRYEIQGHLPLRGTVGRERTIGEVLDALVKACAHRPNPPAHQPRASHTMPGRAGPGWVRGDRSSPTTRSDAQASQAKRSNAALVVLRP
jgi:hypothetical protein